MEPWPAGELGRNNLFLSPADILQDSDLLPATVSFFFSFAAVEVVSQLQPCTGHTADLN